MNSLLSKKNLCLILLLNFCFLLQAQSGLQFKNVFIVLINGDKGGLTDVGKQEVIEEEEFTVDKGTVVKITSSSISQVSDFEGVPSFVSNSEEGMVYLNDFPITSRPEANFPIVTFPIWLRAGVYKLKLVRNTKSNNSNGSINNKLMGLVNGLVYEIE